MRTRSSLRPVDNNSLPLKREQKRLSARPKQQVYQPKELLETKPAAPKSATSALHSGYCEELVGRESELLKIRKLLSDAVSKGQNCSLYISGAPGTGKTACVMQEAERFVSDYEAKLIFINCMQVGTPTSIYQYISDKISSSFSHVKPSTPSRTADAKLLLLEQNLDSISKDLPLLIVLDEIDQLATRQQQVLYRIFDWPRKLRSRIIIIGIANALDLTERDLPKLIANECRPTHISFAPYGREDIIRIVSARLASTCDSGVRMDPLAIQFCARKVSASSGDVRKALAICRRAVELAKQDARLDDKENSDQVDGRPSATHVTPSITHVNRAIREAELPPALLITGAHFSVSATTAPVVSTCGGLPLQHKIVLACCLLLKNKYKMREFPLGKLHEAYKRVCELRQLPECQISDLTSICDMLDSHGLVRVSVPGPKSNVFATPSRMKKVTLCLDDKGLEAALNDEFLLTSILNTKL